MRTVLLNFADNKFYKAQQINTWFAKKLGGFDEVIQGKPEDIDSVFFEENKFIFSQKRGAGAWLWKPYIINKVLDKLNDGDFLFYLDAGAFITRKLTVILNSMGNDNIWVSDIPLIEKQWTKNIVFLKMGADEEVKNSNQIQGTFIGIKKNENTTRLMRNWLKLCCDSELLLSDVEEIENDYFISHREDQSILSTLCKIEGIQPHKDPTQFGRIPERMKKEGRLFRIPKHEDDYPAFIALHRCAKPTIRNIIAVWTETWMPIGLLYRKYHIEKEY